MTIIGALASFSLPKHVFSFTSSTMMLVLSAGMLGAISAVDLIWFAVAGLAGSFLRQAFICTDNMESCTVGKVALALGVGIVLGVASPIAGTTVLAALTGLDPEMLTQVPSVLLAFGGALILQKPLYNFLKTRGWL